MNAAAVGIFGAIGALLRYGLGLYVRDWWSSPFPLGTLLINLAGCLALGWFSSWAAARKGLPAWVRTGVGTGLVGAFTTFSTFSVETVELVRDGCWGFAALYVLASLAGGFLLAWAGYGLFQAQERRRDRRGSET
jgi:CrcB protein